MSILAILEQMRNEQRTELQKNVDNKHGTNRVEYYLNCLERHDLDFYYKHHKKGKNKIYPEEII